VITKSVSAIAAIVSVVSPFKFVISSDKIFVMMPGALSLRSNQATCLYNKDSYNYTLTLNVKFSPANRNNHFLKNETMLKNKM